MITTVLLVIISAIVSSYFFYQSRAHYKKYEKFYNNPTPLYIPLLGNTYLFFNKNLLVVVERIIDMCGKRLVVYVPHRTYFTSDPEEIKVILNEAIDKSKEYNHLKSAFGNSLLLAKAQIWKKHRKIYSKSFKQNILNSFVSTFYHKSNILIDILKRRDYEDIYELFEKLTLDIFQEATIGTKSSIMVDNDNYFVSCITEGQRILFNRIGNVFKMHDFIFFLTNEGKMLKDVILNRLNNFLEPIIQEKRIKMKDEIILNSSGLPLLDLLLTNAQKEKFTNEFVCNEILLFASAATDTTAYSLAYILCLLAMHPLIQQKVYEEVISVIGEGEITSDHILKLKYTEMAIKEALRLLPPIPLIGRQIDCDLDIGTCVIPKGTGVGIPIINLHRDETIYPNPLVYDPNRFLPENVASRHPYSFIPFSEGPRNCIGWKYALMSLKVSTANIIRSFQITTPYKSVTDLKLESSVVMNTTHPLDISFIPR